MEDKSKDVRVMYSILSGRNQHILVIITVGHILVEHMLNKIISAKLENPTKILKKRFSEKLRLLFPTWIPWHIYENIKILNEARNDIVHNLGYTDHEPIIYRDQGIKKILDIPKRKNKEKFYFRELIHTILFDLVNYSFYSFLNIPSEPNWKTIFRTEEGE